jgi:cytochrome c
MLLLLAACRQTEDSAAAWPESFGHGRVASQREIDSLNTDVRPDGQGLPEGRGTVSAGKLLYAQQCARCHGANGNDGPYARLVTRDTASSEKTIGNYWPYASTLYDYIQRAMPFDKPGSLAPDEIYSLTAYLLHANNIIDSTLVLDAKSLPGITMPAQKLFIPDDRTGGPVIR